MAKKPRRVGKRPKRSLTHTWRATFIKEHPDICHEALDVLESDGAFQGLTESRYPAGDVRTKIAETVAFRLDLFAYERRLRETTNLVKQIRDSHRDGARRAKRFATCGVFMQKERFEFESNVAELLDQHLRLSVPLWKKVGRREAWDANVLHSLIVDLAVIICTVSKKPTWYSVFKKGMPPLLRTVRNRWSPILPRQGWTDPAKRFREVRSRNARRSRRSASTVLNEWHADLFYGDRRFRGLHSRPQWPSETGDRGKLHT